MDNISLLQTNPDLILSNSKVWTGSASSPWAEALAISAGRLTAVGRNVEVLRLRSQRTQVLELSGCLILPGFIDNHTHFLRGGHQLLSIDLRGARNKMEFSECIRRKAASLPRGRWITGGDWDHEAWPEAEVPTKDLIDSHTPDTPVLVNRFDGHMVLANSVALQKAGIARTTPDPAGGVIVRDPRTGEPTGILKDAAIDLVARIIPVPRPEEDDEALRAAMKEVSKNGVTSVQDITPWSSFEAFQRARSRSALNVRIYARTPLSQWEEQASWVKRNGVGDDWLKLGGLKAFMDGSLGSATAYFFEAYEDAPSNHGLLADDAVPLGKMEQRMLAADQAGLQLSIHAIGDRANHILLNLFQKVAESNGLRDRRFRTEHAQHLRRDDIPRFARLGVIASMQPYHCADDGRWAGKRIGPERIKTAYAYRSLLDSGAIVTFGSDWTVAPINPLLGIYAAVTRRTLDGKNPQGWVPQEKISLEEALRCYTIYNAYAAFEEVQKGSIEVGKLADLAVLDRDLFATPPEGIQNTKILYTIVDGKVVYGRT